MSSLIPTNTRIWSRKEYMLRWMIDTWPHVRTREDAEREWQKRMKRITRGAVRNKRG